MGWAGVMVMRLAALLLSCCGARSQRVGAYDLTSTAAAPVVELTAANSVEGMTTHRLQLELGDDVHSVYTVFGGPPPSSTIVLPPAYQEDAPFGANIGGSNPAFWAIVPAAEHDSWLSVGVADGSAGTALASVGIEFGNWTAEAGIEIPNGAVFWMAPDTAPPAATLPNRRAVVAQLTTRSGSGWEVSLNAQGRDEDHSRPDWQQHGIRFAYAPAAPVPAPAADLPEPEPKPSELQEPLPEPEPEMQMEPAAPSPSRLPQAAPTSTNSTHEARAGSAPSDPPTPPPPLTLELYSIVLLSACLHAAWNFVIRATKGDMGVVVGGYIVSTPLLVAGCSLQYDLPAELNLGASFWYIIATGVIHAIYLPLVARGYSRGVLSIVYPVSRGSGVAGTALLSVPLYGVELPSHAVAGITLVVVGIMCVGCHETFARHCCPERPGDSGNRGEVRLSKIVSAFRVAKR